MIKTILMSMPIELRIIISRLRAYINDIYAHKSYSQEGEDMILRRIFFGKKDGFYVDVGAHHPRRFSNTNYFYKKGWRGINIEPNSTGILYFKSERYRDKNLQLGISDNTQELTYYIFDEPALNTFDEKMVETRMAKKAYKINEEKNVKIARLDETLSIHMPEKTQIDFLSIDVEGLDLSVLRSNDWNLFRPKIVLVESLETSLEGLIKCEIFNYMRSQQYELFAKTYNTIIFREKSFAYLKS